MIKIYKIYIHTVQLIYVCSHMNCFRFNMKTIYMRSDLDLSEMPTVNALEALLYLLFREAVIYHLVKRSKKI